MAAEIEIAQLRRFAAIVECGSFVEAARRLNITQQALSASIARLEDVAGVRLLDRRRGSSVELTAVGHLLLARARTHLSLSERLMGEIALLRDARGGAVTFGVGETMTGRRVAAAVRRFHKDRSDVQIRLIEGYTEDFADRLLRGELDFVVGSPGESLVDVDELEFRPLFLVRDVLAVRREHPLAGRTNLKLGELAPFSWIVPGFRGDVLKAVQLAFIAEGISPPASIIQSDAVALGTWLCLDGDFIVSVSPDMIGSMVYLGAMTILDIEAPGLVRRGGVIYRRHEKLSPAADQLVREIVREYPAANGGATKQQK